MSDGVTSHVPGAVPAAVATLPEAWDFRPVGMSKFKLPPPGTPVDIALFTPEELFALVKKADGQRAFSRRYGVKRTTLQNQLYKLRKDPFQHRPAPEAREVMERPGRRRFLFTSAQDRTRVFEPFLRNLEAYCEFLRQDAPCDIMIGGFTYSKKLFTEHDPGHSWFHKLVMPYLVTDRVRIANQIDFCGEMNTLPTAANPLSDLKTYTRNRWGIFPHAKVQLFSVPTMKHAPPKHVMTTGAVTMPNYLPKKAGIKASFHHVYGAVLVEIDDDGTFFCRHLIADEDGSFYDLDRFIHAGEVSTGYRIKALTPGDVHVAQVDPVISGKTFGIAPTEDVPADRENGRTWTQVPDNMLDELRPEYLFVHDVSDFRARNHHEIKNPITRFMHHVNGVESVENELREVAAFLSVIQARRPWLQTVVVESNHDQALQKWLDTADYREDPINAEFFLDCQRRRYRAIRTKEKQFSIFEWVMRSFYSAWPCDGVRFLREDEDFMIGGVEHSNHGHRGPNGARGSVVGLSKVGPRITMGHVHSPQILEGVYATGTSSKLDLGYNSGPSSWSHTHCVQYANGKRALVTFMNGRYRL